MKTNNERDAVISALPIFKMQFDKPQNPYCEYELSFKW